MGNFEEKYYQLVKYLSENNNLLPTNGHSLYHFINRLKATQDSLSRYQLSLLNEIDFFNLKSAPNQQEKNWIKKFNQLKDYIEIHGKPPGQIRTSRYPDRYINGKWKTKEEADLHSLSIWVLSQKQHYKKNELSNERINLLSEIGFYFNAKQKFPFTIKMYEQRLKEIVAEGNTNDHKDYHNINSWIKRTNKGLEKYDENDKLSMYSSCPIDPFPFNAIGGGEQGKYSLDLSRHPVKWYGLDGPELQNKLPYNYAVH